jgi:hypothetical protein
MDRARRIGLIATLLLATGFLAAFVQQHYPIQRWLFWHYAGSWLIQLFCALACLSVGNALAAKLLGHRVPLVERMTLGFAAGVLTFGLAVFAVGVVGALSAITFFALPLLLIASGFERLQRDVRGLCRLFPPRRLLTFEPLSLLLFVAGVAGVALLYFEALSPDVFGFDVRWYHASLAQRYALSGRIGRLEEGFWLGAYPQLMTYIYTWVFLAPRAILFDKLEACLNLEVLLFVATLAQIPVLLRRLLPRARVGLTWVVTLAFPGIYLYDSNLNAGADHFLGFFALPMALGLWRAWWAFTPVNVLCAAVFLAAGALTKYSALCIVLPPALALVLRGVYLALVRRSPGAWRSLGVLGLAPTLLTAPHWLKNWLWYGDPVYPMLFKHLNVHPWSADAEFWFLDMVSAARPSPFTPDGIWEGIKAAFTFAFLPNDWAVFHRDWPVFGFLFTLSLPCLLFLRGARRIWWLYAGGLSAVFIWYMSNHYDRYLQAILPWMAAATGGTFVLIWQSGKWARWALLPLIALQCIWGGDIPFFRTHNLIRDSSINYSSQFLASGFEGTAHRLRVYEPLGSIGESLPKQATVLIHDYYRPLGLDRNWVTDRMQNRISYGTLLSPRAIHQELRDLGVTHVFWNAASERRDSLAGDLAFLRYVSQYTEDWKRFSPFNVARLPAEPPAESALPDRVALFACEGPYASGWYDLAQLTIPNDDASAAPSPGSTELELAGAVARAAFIVVEMSCHGGVEPGPPFVAVGSRAGAALYVRSPR